MSNPETIADLLDELRSGEYAPLADRLDAAWKREKATTEKSSAVGNGAKLREALKQIASIPMPPPIHLAQQCAREMREKAIAALAAPPRNCDIYKTKKDAEAAFLSEECKHPCGNCTVNDEYGCALVHECGVDWLFATATEKEGGAK